MEWVRAGYATWTRQVKFKCGTSMGIIIGQSRVWETCNGPISDMIWFKKADLPCLIKTLFVVDVHATNLRTAICYCQLVDCFD